MAHAAVRAKFLQNPTLRNVLVNTGSAKIAESSPDDYWGTGLHLYARNALDPRYWSNQGGVICEIYESVRSELLGI